MPCSTKVPSLSFFWNETGKILYLVLFCSPTPTPPLIAALSRSSNLGSSGMLEAG